MVLTIAGVNEPEPVFGAPGSVEARGGSPRGDEEPHVRRGSKVVHALHRQWIRLKDNEENDPWQREQRPRFHK